MGANEAEQVSLRPDVEAEATSQNSSPGWLRQSFNACDRSVLLRAVAVALVVGPTVLLINQGPSVLDRPSDNLWRIALTMLVPFCVSCFSSISARLHAVRALTDFEGLEGFDGRSPRDRLVSAEGTVKTIQANATRVNETSKARFQHTVDLLNKAQATQASIAAGEALIASALTSLEGVASQIAAVSGSQAETETEIRASADTSARTTRVIETARTRITEVAALAGRIEQIGRQTTILSLNAAITAANAGPAGKPFAVIAEAIRVLAKSTETQARSIDAAMAELRTSSDELQRSAGALQASFVRLQAQSQQGAQVVLLATHSLDDSSRRTRECISALNTQAKGFREVVAGIANVVDNAEAAINGSAQNMHLAKQAVEDIAFASATGSATDHC